MKKKILQICSLSILAIILTAVSAGAQTLQKYEAEIPFAFEIGNKSYEAGVYKIHLTRPSGIATIMAIKDSEGSELQRTAVVRNGNTSKKTGATSLVFNRSGNDYRLWQIVSPRFGFNAPKSKRGKVRVDYLGKKPETVSLVLKKLGKKAE